MKIARHMLPAVLSLVLATSGARGDSPASADAAAINPYSTTDPDGVPMSVTQTPLKPASQAEIDAYRKQQDRAALDKDWLLRSYEQQMQIHEAAKSSQGGSGNLYYQLSSNKDLAKLAGLPSISSSDDRTGANRTSPGNSQDTRANLSPGANSAALSVNTSHVFFKPLVSPFGAPEAAGLHNFYATLPLAVSPLFPSNGGAKPAPAPQADASVEPSALDTPGLTAAQNDPAMDNRAGSDLTLDILPGESVAEAREHQDNNSKLELALPPAAAQPQKTVTSGLGVPSTAKATASTTAKPPVAKDPNDEPIPVDKVIQPSPVHSPIANPYDIFYR